MINCVILKKKEGVWFSLFHKFELLTAIALSSYNRFLDYNVPKFKIMYQSIPAVNIPPGDSHILFAQPPGVLLTNLWPGAGV